MAEGNGQPEEGREKRERSGDWKRLLASVVVHTPGYLKLGWALARAPEIPREKKTGLLGGVLYSLSPIDLVPGFVPVLGQLDDLAALLGGIRSALSHCPPEVADRLLHDSGVTREMLDDDFRALGKIALGFSGAVAKSTWKGGVALGGFVARGIGRGVLTGARALRDAYEAREARLAAERTEAQGETQEGH